jgi:ABC-2 type transport system ATP-binding protein
MINTFRLRKEYENIVALKSLDLSIPAGEIFGLIGPNGAGKTTLLNILGTVLQPDFGQVSIAGINVEDQPLAVRRLIGYMPDFYALYEDMTTEDFITYFGLAFGVDKKILPETVDRLLHQANLTTKRESKISELSRGMRQRLVFAKTLVHDPEVLLLDEPLSGLDPLARTKMRELLRGLKARGKTVVISSHILTELSDFCTMVGILERGKLRVCGKIDEVLARFAGERMVTVEVVLEGALARDIISGIPGVKLEPGKGEVIKLRCRERETIAVINSALVAAGIKVLSITEDKGDIEDIYFKVASHEVS